jgi:hypothetical protein
MSAERPINSVPNQGLGEQGALNSFTMGYKFVAPEKIPPTMLAQKVPFRALTKDVVAIVLNEKLESAKDRDEGGYYAAVKLREMRQQPTCRICLSAVSRYHPALTAPQLLGR